MTTKKMTAAKAMEMALSLCGGDYQRAIVLGYARLSGSDLKGKARQYSSKYANSRRAILARMTAAGIPWMETKGERGTRILVIGKER